MAFSPDGKKIFAAYFGPFVHGGAGLWKIDGSVISDLGEVGNLITRACFSSDSKKLFTYSRYELSKLWGTEGDTLIKDFGNIGFPFAISKDWYSILTDRGLWNMNGDGRKFDLDNEAVCSAAFSKDQQRVVFLYCDNNKAIIQNLSGNILHILKGGPLGEDENATAFAEDGSGILTSSSHNKTKLWNIYGGLLKEYQINKDENRVSLLAFSSDASKILICVDYKTIRLLNVSGNLIKQFKPQKDSITSIAFSPNENKFFTASIDGTGRLWNLDGALLKEVDVRKGKEEITSVALSWDGTKIFTGCSDGVARLWNFSGSLQKEVSLQKGEISSITFSRDDKNVLIGSIKWGRKNSASQAIGLWQTDGTWVREFGGSIAAFSPDGKKIITGVRQTNYSPGLEAYTINGTLLYNFSTKYDDIISVAFSPDGKKVLVGKANGFVAVYENVMTLDEFINSDKIEPLTDKQKIEFGIK